MGVYAQLWLDEVRLAEAKALDGLKGIYARLVKYNEKFSSSLEGLKRQWEPLIQAVENGEMDAVDALVRTLEEEGFQVDRAEGFLHLVDWGEDGYDKSGDEGLFLSGLGDVLEAGGTVGGRIEEGDERPFEYRFFGGSYELAWAAQDCMVGKSDQERVKAAFKVASGLLPPDALEVLREALARADFFTGEDESKAEKGEEQA